VNWNSIDGCRALTCKFLHREAKRSDWRAKQQLARQEEVSHKLSAAQAAEDAKMAAFRAIIAQGPITIPKRQ
jgi:hypothetical protein